MAPILSALHVFEVSKPFREGVGENTGHSMHGTSVGWKWKKILSSIDTPDTRKSKKIWNV